MLRVETLRQRFSAVIDDRDVVILLSELLQQNSAFVLAHSKTSLSLFQYFRFRWCVRQREKGYSVAAIIGHKEFFGLDFIVSKHTLIPRPETELLVEETLKIITPGARLVDVGTGTGCIPIALLKNIPSPIQTWVIDKNRQALATAKKNAKKHQTRINFLSGNLLAPLPDSVFINGKSLIITANLPYLTHEQFASEPSIQREPYQALVAQKDGLALYEELFKQLQTKNSVARTTVLCEIDPAQPLHLIQIIQSYFPTAKTIIKKDLAGRDRLVMATINS